MSEKPTGNDPSVPGNVASDDATTASAEGTEAAGNLSPHEEIEALRSKIESLKQESAANYDRFVRERAELENFKRRMQREKAEALRFAIEPLVRELLPAVDNLERALEHASANDASVIEGVRLVLKSLLETLERHGVKRIEAVGQPFNPKIHEAISQVESDEAPANSVVTQHHVGYQLHDRLLRPAMVTVSKKSGKRDSAVATAPDSD